MARSILSGLILVLLPLALLSGTIFRFTIISFIYGLFLLILPWLGGISERNIRSKLFKIHLKYKSITKSILARFRILILLIGLISLLAILAQIIFQSILLAKKPYGHTLVNCKFNSQLKTKQSNKKFFEF